MLVKHCGSHWQHEFLQGLSETTLLYNLQLVTELMVVIANNADSDMVNCCLQVFKGAYGFLSLEAR